MRSAAIILTVALTAGAPAGAERVAPNLQMDLQQIGRKNMLVGRDMRVRQQNGRRVTTANVVEPFDGKMTAANIERSVEGAICYLRSLQRENGSIGEGSYAQGGSTALAALTMLAAGQSPITDDCLKRALNWLLTVEVDNTYVHGIRANVWEYALRKVPYDQAMKKALQADYDWLMKALGKKEGWRYRMNSSDWDNSVTQYGVLGIWAAARAGISPGDEFWVKMSKHFRSVQNSDGGWGYQRGGSTPNMATAGLATMFLVFDKYHGKSYYTHENPRAFTSGDAAECLRSIERGMAWLGKRGGTYDDGYYLYGIERTGVASGRKHIGGADWFAKGADMVLRRQQRNGCVSMRGHGGHVGHTAFSALFMVYGGAPAAFNKLEYGKGQDWNLNPRDLANLAKYLWSAYERPLNWHSVSISAPASEFEAPVLFISGSKAVKFSDKEVAKLREYVESGGTILAEPTDHSKEFAASMEQLLHRIYPLKDYPSCTMEKLDADHGVYTVLRQEWKERPVLHGASDGSRTFFLLSDGYMSADWQMNRTESDSFKLAMNLLFYATDLKELKGRFASILPDTEPTTPRKTLATVARIRHNGSEAAPMDWAAGRSCWRRYAEYARHVTGCELVEKDPVDLAKDDLTGIKLLHMTGKHAFDLNEAQRQALKAYVEGGGTLLVDACSGSNRFAGSARELLEDLFSELEDLDDGSLLASGKFTGGSDISRKIRYKLAARKLLRKKGLSTKSHHLKVAHVGKRPAVIFSDADLTYALAGVDSYQSVGYKPESARRVVGNVLAYVMVD